MPPPLPGTEILFHEKSAKCVPSLAGPDTQQNQTRGYAAVNSLEALLFNAKPCFSCFAFSAELLWKSSQLCPGTCLPSYIKMYEISWVKM